MIQGITVAPTGGRLTFAIYRETTMMDPKKVGLFDPKPQTLNPKP